MTDSGPDHSKRFHAVVLLSGDEIAAGDGTSKKQAEMAAALDAWSLLQQGADGGKSAAPAAAID